VIAALLGEVWYTGLSVLKPNEIFLAVRVERYSCIIMPYTYLV